MANKLFELIKSLTPNEKGYFKKASHLHVKGEENNYIKLFDSIEKQSVYNEKKIKHQFAKEKFIQRLPVIKAYLYDAIIDSMIEYHEESFSNLRMNKYLQTLQILDYKNQTDQARKVLIKAKAEAYKYELYPTLLELIKWEKQFLTSDGVLNANEEKLNSLSEEQLNVINKLNNIDHYWLLSRKNGLVSLKLGKIRSRQDQEAYEKKAKELLFSNYKDATSFEAKKYFLENNSRFFMMTGKKGDDCIIWQLAVELEETYSHQIEENLWGHIALLFNYLLSCIENKKYDQKFYKYLSEFEEIEPSYSKNKFLTPTVIANRFCLHQIIIFKLAINQKENYTNINQKYINESENKLEKSVSAVNKYILFQLYFNYFYVLFINEKYKLSLKWLNRIMNDPDFNLRSDIHCVARIVNIVLHFELKNEDLLESQIRSAYRFLSKRDRLYKFENEVLGFIRKKLPRSVGNKRLIEEFRILKNKLEELVQDPYEREFLNYFDFISWLESKIKNKDFKTILREKTN